MGIKGILAVGFSLIFLAGCATSHQKKTEPVPVSSEFESVQAPVIQEPVMQESAPAPEVVVDPMKMTKRDVQNALKNAGYYKGKADGSFGPKTRAAIKEFQKANGLQQDGLAGKQTRAALVKYLNKQ